MTNQKGSALLYVFLVSALVLGGVLTFVSVFVARLKISQDQKKSVRAFYVADSGAEWQLYNIRKNVNEPQPTFYNPGDVSPIEVDRSMADVLKVIGTYQGISRSVELQGGISF